MCTLSARALSVVAALAALPLLAQTDPAELVKHPQYASSDRKPVLKKLTAEEVRSAVQVTSSRNSAVFGFNDPGVEIHLPRVDNSNWIDDEFTTPKLFDKRNREVKFEKEQGIYSHDTWSTEIRFTGERNKPVEFAKAVGSVKIKYPIAMKTVSIKKSETKKAADTGVIFDGPFIKTDLAKVPEAAFGTQLDGVRAYDKSGKRLEKVMGYSSSAWEDGVSYRGYAFHGDVARVDVDTVDQWVTLAIDYEMPPVPKLPDSMNGAPSKAAAKIEPTPGGKFTVKIAPVEP
jgi:hypothetical protein